MSAQDHHQFTCANCGGAFCSETSEEELETEAVEAFGEVPDDKVSVCDDCYPVLMAAAKEAGLL